MTENREAPTREGVEAAARRIAGWVTRTPLLPFEWRGRRLWAKAECLQQGGAFKLRGATNRLLQLTDAEKRHGVVAFSSGNHARGVAIAARRLGIAATIVMPSDAPVVKREATAAEGAAIVLYDRMNEDRIAIAGRISQETGAIVVPSFDDVDIVEGQGTVGIEIGEQLGREPPLVVVPCGGGGLSSGIALALPGSRVVPVEPAAWDDMARSLERGEIVPVGADAPPTRLDALQTPVVSPYTFGVLHARGVRGLAVSDVEAFAAMRFAFDSLRLVVEPGGAAALAAVLADKVADVPEGSVVVLSGGNVDPGFYASVLNGSAA
ncbi:threonine/serine dehydratase [Sphingosinicella sp. YJ22]|uniref:threonine ammonia-lyase n=1 Tax=Sphingosinicella sp. YJ22 TaxID=1104780 RepID=UPI001408EB62|nr:threonine/serine dehydratase [Sphingosinicella sp. YJ22]